MYTKSSMTKLMKNYQFFTFGLFKSLSRALINMYTWKRLRNITVLLVVIVAQNTLAEIWSNAWSFYCYISYHIMCNRSAIHTMHECMNVV